jgi:hypothetical protein
MDQKCRSSYGLGDSGVHYSDLCDDKWSVARVTSSGWDIINGWDVVDRLPPVFSHRIHDLLPLPMPEHGGSIDFV